MYFADYIVSILVAFESKKLSRAINLRFAIKFLAAASSLLDGHLSVRGN